MVFFGLYLQGLYGLRVLDVLGFRAWGFRVLTFRVLALGDLAFRL